MLDENIHTHNIEWRSGCWRGGWEPKLPVRAHVRGVKRNNSRAPANDLRRGRVGRGSIDGTFFTLIQQYQKISKQMKTFMVFIGAEEGSERDRVTSQAGLRLAGQRKCIARRSRREEPQTNYWAGRASFQVFASLHGRSHQKIGLLPYHHDRCSLRTQTGRQRWDMMPSLALMLIFKTLNWLQLSRIVENHWIVYFQFKCLSFSSDWIRFVALMRFTCKKCI